ncbi:hypothetical protein [Eupransor demetentiae]|uniref:Uncharacterized protein n=1 Tax=Eupransor demetentiae TaxID=3109584 RepID=A0ABM9N720_9LACO|nr:hypothetical protein R54876_GBNLAHCA_01333 [Lactobacillaceae bacterium LMG 33000]
MENKIDDQNMNKYDEVLFQSLQEMTEKLNDSSENPVSLSLHLWQMGIRDAEAKDKLMHETTKLVFSGRDPLTLTYMDFHRAFAKLYPNTFNDPKKDGGDIRYILTWIGRIMPRVYPVAKNIHIEGGADEKHNS